ncbi:type 1 glutamine amidotransferase [Mesorhizobium sp. Root157]|uniref:type 1 glutamine amidotransferase n=1 Tax=Mesorhizobium sp. Root157 TaxID=1736477 RepID=UPI000ABC6190|nr:type 1 glutamine amidotransferase [Mesorhizobium sp. Root157]
MRILIFQHLAVEHAGCFGDFWRQDGHEMKVVELDEGESIPNLDDFDLLAVMGGPMDTWQEDVHPWLVAEKAAIRRWVKDMGRPYLGICLGHQLLADALGGKVSLMARPEVGLARVKLTRSGRDDRLFLGVNNVVETLQWHGAEVSELPEHGEILAANAACPVQAMKWGRHAYGFQYHMEITDRTVGDWKLIPEYRASLEKALGIERAEGLAAEVAPRLGALKSAARQINDNFWALVRSPTT